MDVSGLEAMTPGLSGIRPEHRNDALDHLKLLPKPYIPETSTALASSHPLRWTAMLRAGGGRDSRGTQVPSVDRLTSSNAVRESVESAQSGTTARPFCAVFTRWMIYAVNFVGR